MSTASDILKSVFSREDDNSYEEREDNKPESGETVVTSKGDDSDNGPKEQEVQSVQKDGKDVDDAFNEEHTDPNPASVEDLDEESIPTEEEVEKMSEEIPEAPEEGDTVMTEDGPEVENPPSVEETPEESAPVDPEAVAPVTDGEGTGDITDPENKEAGIDPVQALECILYSREEDIQIIKDGVQISIDEENKVQIDQNASSGSEGGESTPENTEGSEGGENTEGSEGAEGSEGSENTEGEENSTESMSIKRIADYFC